MKQRLGMIVFLMSVFVPGVTGGEVDTSYRDTSLPLEQRVNALLSQMTLEEKIGQINMPCVYQSQLGRDIPAKMEGCKKFAAGTLEEGVGPGGGFFTLPNTILREGTEQQVTYINEIQKIAVENTRLGIPLLLTEEGTHGLMCAGGTIFPEGLALGSTWNTRLLEEMYSVTAKEGRSIGMHQLFTLVVEPNRDPRLGRNQEGYSEDPFLCSRIAEAIVRGVQGDDISRPDKTVAGLCHYPGQSQPVSGLERGAMEISERMLREVFLPPWVAGIRDSGALGVMATYPAIDGVPVHASQKILTDMLRGELNFEGLVLGEGGGLETLLYEGLAANDAEAGALALRAGLDVGISYEPAYMRPMRENIKSGHVSEELLDRAVKRILRQKMRLGLFENPYVDLDTALKTVHANAHQDLALQVAREGIVLLKNENQLLPLDKNLKSIAVIGPNANHEKNQLGDYTSIHVTQDIVTVLEGIQNTVSAQTQVRYIQGCDVIGEAVNDIEAAARVAKECEVAIVVVGENEWRTEGKKGTNGEGYDVASLDLTGLQLNLVKAVEATGTPTVVVLINGRPLSTRWIAEHIPAILDAWICGEKGGQAVAEILFGDINPSGRLPITVPRHVGQLPAYYNYKPSKKYWIENAWGKPYADMDPHPLYPFGFGLSYTQFEYSYLRIDNQYHGDSPRIEVSVNVQNTGQREGQEVVQLYVNDVVSSVVTPIRELRGFEKITLRPGETKTVAFTLRPEHVQLLNQDMQWVVEPGEFEVMVGRSCEDIPLRDRFVIAP